MLKFFKRKTQKKHRVYLCKDCSIFNIWLKLERFEACKFCHLINATQSIPTPAR